MGVCSSSRSSPCILISTEITGWIAVKREGERLTRSMYWLGRKLREYKRLSRVLMALMSWMKWMR
jgi:hypothetical protein